MSKLVDRLRVCGLPGAFVLLILSCSISACAPAATPTLFIPPVQPTPPPVQISPTQVRLSPPAPTHMAATPAPTSLPCTDGLSFVNDVTIPDNTPFSPGQPIDKQWLVTNSGTCDWDAGYRLKLIGGSALGAQTDQALYPARAGSQATLRILFTAPADTGTYLSSWQAYNLKDEAFGDPIYAQIVVQ